MADKKSSTLRPIQIGIKTALTNELSPNPYNPRMLFDRKPLQTLKASIEKVGILVPLTVYWDDEIKKYVILDGQRRWICAQQLDLKNVPVNQVAKPTVVENIVTMFQIHKLREDWELMPTALKLEVLMEEMQERNDKKLAELTRLDLAVVSRCKKLLSYPKKYHDMMLDIDPQKREKADFFIELYTIRHDQLVRKMEWFQPDAFTDRMREKYQNKRGLKNVTDFRIMKQYINNARNAHKFVEISKRLKEFTLNDTLPLDHLNIQSAEIKARSGKFLDSVRKFEDELSSMDVSEFYGEEEIWKMLEKLLHTIQQKLKQADRKLK